MSDVEDRDDPIRTSRFDTATKLQLQAVYGSRCAICLRKITVSGCQFGDILDASEEGASQVAMCSQLDIIPCDYQRQSLQNGMILCSQCHVLLSHDYIALCPPKEILEYLVKYVKDTPAGKQMPLYQVFQELTSLNPQGLPDRSAILPYIGLYTIVNLKPTKEETLIAIFPPLSILHNGRWENAPDQTAPTALNVAYIFDSLAVDDSDHFPPFGILPLHLDVPQYSQKRYWRLPNVNLGGIMSAVILHGVLTPHIDDEQKIVKVLFSFLTINKLGVTSARPNCEGYREDEEGGGRRGGKGQGGTQKQLKPSGR